VYTLGLLPVGSPAPPHKHPQNDTTVFAPFRPGPHPGPVGAVHLLVAEAIGRVFVFFDVVANGSAVHGSPPIAHREDPNSPKDRLLLPLDFRPQLPAYFPSASGVFVW